MMKAQIYRSGLRRRWRWRLVHSNGTLANSGHGYVRQINMMNTLAAVTGTTISADRQSLVRPNGVTITLEDLS